jgi:hypothetical protein
MPCVLLVRALCNHGTNWRRVRFARIEEPDMVDKSEKFSLLVRLGYAARGLVYVLLGYLALSSARGVAGGLLAYALYKLIAGVGDIEHKGSSAKGIAQRIGYLASGLAHIVLAWTAFEFAHGDEQSSGGDGSSQAAATLLAWDMGAFILGLIGLGFAAAALFQVRSALTAHFMRTVGAGAPAAICWIGRIGHAARAIVFLVIGWSLVKSGWLDSGSEAKGLGGALLSLSQEGALYTVVAIGLLAFGVFSLIVARFRIIPDVDRSDLKPSVR